MIPYTHLEIRRVKNLSDPSKPWSVSWRTAIMRAPAFAYYASRDEALLAWPELAGRPLVLVPASRA